MEIQKYTYPFEHLVIDNFFTDHLIEKILGLRVNIINKKNNSGKITIEYKNLDQFDLISDLLTKN